MSTPVVNEGTTIRFYTSTGNYPEAPAGPFLDIEGNPVDPDIVTFQYQLPNTEPIAFVYTAPSGDPTHTIVRVATGEYYADIPTTGLAGDWIWRWSGEPNPENSIDETHTAVATEGVITILASDIIF